MRVVKSAKGQNYLEKNSVVYDFYQFLHTKLPVILTCNLKPKQMKKLFLAAGVLMLGLTAQAQEKVADKGLQGTWWVAGQVFSSEKPEMPKPIPT
jgi:hypothetical protein